MPGISQLDVQIESNPETLISNNSINKTIRKRITQLDTLYLVIFLILNYIIADAMIEQRLNALHIGLYSLIYIGFISFVVRIKQIKPNKESWFWLTLFIAITISYFFGVSESMSIWQFFLYFFVMIYWTATLFSGLIQHKTSNFLLIDIINFFILTPIKNGFLSFSLSYDAWHNNQLRLKTHKQKQNIKSIFIIFSITIILLAVIIPLLIDADSSEQFSYFFTHFFNLIFDTFSFSSIYLFFAKIIVSGTLSIYSIAQLVSIAYSH